jgi:uncharacterized membrane protein YvlD (DUF360 family)
MNKKLTDWLVTYGLLFVWGFMVAYSMLSLVAAVINHATLGAVLWRAFIAALAIWLLDDELDLFRAVKYHRNKRNNGE